MECYDSGNIPEKGQPQTLVQTQIKIRICLQMKMMMKAGFKKKPEDLMWPS
jgi:hypothetical protein